MIINMKFLIAKYWYEIELPYLVWAEIKTETICAIHSAMSHDFCNMIAHIIKAETAISLYNATVWYHVDEERENEDITSESLRLTGYNRISYLIEQIYNRYTPF